MDIVVLFHDCTTLQVVMVEVAGVVSESIIKDDGVIKTKG